MDKTKTAGTSGRFFYSYQLTIYSKKLIIYSMNIKITRYDLNYLVTESVKRILNEDQTAKSISQAKRLLMQQFGWDAEKSDSFLRLDLRNQFPSLRERAAKFILGVTRMYVNGELNDDNINAKLDSTLLIISSEEHINEFDRNLNGLSANDLINKFDSEISSTRQKDSDELDKLEYTQNNSYNIVRINSFREASRYAQYTSWCVTHSGEMFDSYTSNGINQFYFCLRDGYENEPEDVGDNAPLDDYGLSMFAVSVDENGLLKTCTCRWNHSNGGNDNVMNTREISMLIGRNFYTVFRPNNVFKEKVENAIRQLANGEDLCNIFEIGLDFYECGDLIPVMICSKQNYLKPDGTFLLKKWYDSLGPFIDGVASVSMGSGYNYIDVNEHILLSKNYDACYSFSNGFGCVAEDDYDGYSYFRPVRKDGTFLNNDWYFACDSFSEGLAVVENVYGKYNYLKEDGTYLFDTWFDDCSAFKNGLAIVKDNENEDEWFVIKPDGTRLNDEAFTNCDTFGSSDIVRVTRIDSATGRELFNLLRKNGTLVFKTFIPNKLGAFNDGLAPIQLNEGWNYIDENGNILTEKIYGLCKSFKNGFGIVQSSLGHYYSIIRRDGTRINNVWYTSIDLYNEYHNEFIARVEKNGNYNILKNDGTVIPEFWSISYGPILTEYLVTACDELTKKWYVYFINGQKATNEVFDDCYGCNKLYLIMARGGSKYFIDKNGKVIPEKPI